MNASSRLALWPGSASTIISSQRHCSSTPSRAWTDESPHSNAWYRYRFHIDVVRAFLQCIWMPTAQRSPVLLCPRRSPVTQDHFVRLGAGLAPSQPLQLISSEIFLLYPQSLLLPFFSLWDRLRLPKKRSETTVVWRSIRLRLNHARICLILGARRNCVGVLAGLVSIVEGWVRAFDSEKAPSLFGDGSVVKGYLVLSSKVGSGGAHLLRSGNCNCLPSVATVSEPKQSACNAVSWSATHHCLCTQYTC